MDWSELIEPISQIVLTVVSLLVAMGVKRINDAGKLHISGEQERQLQAAVRYGVGRAEQEARRRSRRMTAGEKLQAAREHTAKRLPSSVPDDLDDHIEAEVGHMHSARRAVE